MVAVNYWCTSRSNIIFLGFTGCLNTSPGSSTVTTSQLILSGGEGYINFRIGELKGKLLWCWIYTINLFVILKLLISNLTIHFFRRRCWWWIRWLPKYTAAVWAQSHDHLPGSFSFSTQLSALTACSPTRFTLLDGADMLCCTCRTWDHILNDVPEKLNKWNYIILKCITMKYDEYCFNLCKLKYLYWTIVWRMMLTVCLYLYHVVPHPWISCLIVKNIFFIFALTLYNLSGKTLRPQSFFCCFVIFILFTLCNYTLQLISWLQCNASVVNCELEAGVGVTLKHYWRYMEKMNNLFFQKHLFFSHSLNHKCCFHSLITF